MPALKTAKASPLFLIVLWKCPIFTR